MNRSDAELIKANTPHPLRELPQWVCWRIEDRKGKPTKVPYVPGTSRGASSTAARDWRTFDEAITAFEADPSLVGVGFVFSADGPYCGVDIDDCRDADSGDIVPWAQAIIDSLDSYTEVSPSGTGVKIFLRAAKPGGKCRKAYESGEIEMYDSGRYFTVTGAHLPCTPTTIEERLEPLNALYLSVFGTDADESARESVSIDVALSDDEIVKLVTSGRKNNEKFAALWAGRWNDYYNSPSEADSSLVFKLAYYTKDAAQIDRIFRQSALYRDKWDELRGAETYGNITIQNALAKVTKQYKPRKGRRSTQGASGGSSGGGEAAGSSQAGTRHPRSGRLILDTERTLPTAQAFVREFFTELGSPCLKHYANIFFGWKDNRYAEVEDSTMRHKLLPWLTDALRARFDPVNNEWTYVDFPANPRSVSSALDSVKADTHLPATMKPPLWLDGGEGRPDPRELLACKSSLLHLPTMEHHPPTPAFLSFNALDYDPDPDADEPELWFGFLDQIFGDDEQSKELLQDWFGYCLTGDTSQQKMLLMVGPKRSGKGTIARVLTHLVGSGNVCGPTTSSLAGDFGLQPLIGKNLAIVSDARFSGDRIQAVVERLLCISGEDLLTVDRKHLPSVHLQLPTRFVFLTNEIPRLCDASGALAGRFMVLKFTQSFYGREDKTLTKKLTAELPGILNWAIEGWKRLRKRERFIQPESVGSVLEDMEHLSSPVLAFVNECCTTRTGCRCSINDIYEAFGIWSNRDGIKVTPTKQTFGRNLQAAVPDLAVKRNHEEGRFYEGIDLTAEYRDVLQDRRRDKAFSALNRETNVDRTDPWEDIGFIR